MNGPVSAGEVERFRSAVARRLGLQFEDGKLGFLAEVLRRRLDRSVAAEYLAGLEDNPSSEEIGALARELTVGETYFFRNNEQFRALAEVVLPERMRADRRPRVLRLLSAGCASGEEAYSLAIVARETVHDPSWETQVRAVDLNPASLQKAEQARYSAWALRETPADVRQRWFRMEGRDATPVEAARAAVRFEQKNLIAEDSGLWPADAYDVIFCRNVMMYFAPEPMRSAITHMADSLAPGGFLFLGHAETLRGLSDDFHLRHTHETFYYQRKSSGERAGGRTRPVARTSFPFAAPAEGLADAWVDAIRHASERVANLIPAAAPVAPRPAAPPAWDRAETIDLLRRERFAEALACVRQPTPLERGADPDKLLLEATLFAPCGPDRGRRGRLSPAAVGRRIERRGQLRAGALPRAGGRPRRGRRARSHRDLPRSRIRDAASASRTAGASRRRPPLGAPGAGLGAHSAPPRRRLAGAAVRRRVQSRCFDGVVRVGAADLWGADVSFAPSRAGDRAAEMRAAFDRSFAGRARLDAAPCEDFLAIRVASDSYAIRCSEISGLVAGKSITRVPSRAAALLGLGGFRGAIMPVYSLAALLGHALAPAPRWIVIASGLPVALAFEALDGNRRVSRQEIAPHEADQRARKYIRDFMREHDRVRAILHLPSILEAIREQGSASQAIEEG